MGATKVAEEGEIEPRKYTFLDVYSLQQGRERIRLSQIIVLLLFGISVYKLTETLLFWNVVDTDARDIVDDFRLTLPATQAAHDRFAADNDLFQFSLLMETPLQTIELADVKTRILATLPILSPIFAKLPSSWQVAFSKSACKTRFYFGELLVDFGAYQRAATTTFTLVDRRGAAPGSNLTRANVRSRTALKMYETYSNYDARTTSISRLASVRLFVQSISPKALIAKRNSSVVVHFNRSTRDNPTLPTEQYWRIVEARPTYTSFWTGRLLDTASSDWLAAATGSAPLAAADGNKPTANISSLASPPKSDTQRVSIELHDVSEPVPGHPPFATTNGLLVTLGVFALTILAVIIHAYFSYLIRLNANLNNNLPPPFFEGMRKFRGW